MTLRLSKHALICVTVLLYIYKSIDTGRQVKSLGTFSPALGIEAPQIRNTFLE